MDYFNASDSGNINYNDDFFDGDFLSSNQILKLKSGDTSKIFGYAMIFYHLFLHQIN